MPLRNAITIDTQHHLKGCRATWQPIDQWIQFTCSNRTSLYRICNL